MMRAPSSRGISVDRRPRRIATDLNGCPFPLRVGHRSRRSDDRDALRMGAPNRNAGARGASDDFDRSLGPPPPVRPGRSARDVVSGTMVGWRSNDATTSLTAIWSCPTSGGRRSATEVRGSRHPSRVRHRPGGTDDAAPRNDCEAIRGMAVLVRLTERRNVYADELHGSQESPLVFGCLVDGLVAQWRLRTIVPIELLPGARDAGSKAWSGEDGRGSLAMSRLLEPIAVAGIRRLDRSAVPAKRWWGPGFARSQATGGCYDRSGDLGQGRRTVRKLPPRPGPARGASRSGRRRECRWTRLSRRSRSSRDPGSVPGTAWRNAPSTRSVPRRPATGSVCRGPAMVPPP